MKRRAPVRTGTVSTATNPAHWSVAELRDGRGPSGAYRINASEVHAVRLDTVTAYFAQYGTPNVQAITEGVDTPFFLVYMEGRFRLPGRAVTFLDGAPLSTYHIRHNEYWSQLVRYNDAFRTAATYVDGQRLEYSLRDGHSYYPHPIPTLPDGHEREAFHMCVIASGRKDVLVTLDREYYAQYLRIRYINPSITCPIVVSTADTADASRVCLHLRFATSSDALGSYPMVLERPHMVFVFI